MEAASVETLRNVNCPLDSIKDEDISSRRCLVHWRSLTDASRVSVTVLSRWLNSASFKVGLSPDAPLDEIKYHPCLFMQLGSMCNIFAHTIHGDKCQQKQHSTHLDLDPTDCPHGTQPGAVEDLQLCCVPCSVLAGGTSTSPDIQLRRGHGSRDGVGLDFGRCFTYLRSKGWIWGEGNFSNWNFCAMDHLSVTNWHPGPIRESGEEIKVSIINVEASDLAFLAPGTVPLHSFRLSLTTLPTELPLIVKTASPLS
ncbi:hypothetical protein N7539_003833 [Penicillium diatomitis]|uniref:Uncharacterized protein n=1 Tax=Penicillium diatomitis TaxID=2819901 RepID=A0A9W9XDB1_9EURO|nr:uncharacterized protein N7539_003833 [Penicillium diatomitis]KAJ5488943.1 hypothetical protein N7539_003833 [Penicillium diatomitis]